MDLLGLGLSQAQIGELVAATGARDGKPSLDLLGLQKSVLPRRHGDGVSQWPAAVRALAQRRPRNERFARHGGPLMPRSPLFGRRVHISGSVVNNPVVAASADVMAARELIVALVKALMKRGANFVVPVDARSAARRRSPKVLRLARLENDQGNARAAARGRAGAACRRRSAPQE